MQGYHHHNHNLLQQQLAALLSAASGGDSVSSTAAGLEGPSDRSGESSRVAALNSLHRTILYTPNSPLLSHSASFLSHGFSQLLSDKLYPVRRAAAVAYGSLCATIGGGFVDRFICQTLPMLRDVYAIDGVREFLSVGDGGSADRYVPSILRACQELLEDERTSFGLLRHLLSLLTLISLKFGNCFEAHFVDIVDLLLGWAFMPGLSDTDRRFITDSFLQFQKHWLSNLQFSIGLLRKFLGDMEVLIQDGNFESGRFLALFSCFTTVLQVMASGVLEMDLAKQIMEPVEDMAPRLLRCISSFNAMLGCSKWMDELWRCLITLAEILHEKFADFYSMAIDILFQCLREVPSFFQVHWLIKTNLQLLSLQRLGLLPSSVESLLQSHLPLSRLRLHPNHLVVASSAATYLCFLQHRCSAVVSQAITSLIEELELLKGMLGDTFRHSEVPGVLQVDFEIYSQAKPDSGSVDGFSELELLSMIKFDLRVLLCSVSPGASSNLTDLINIDTSKYERSKNLTSFILGKLNPFEFPVQECLELQVHVVRTLHKLSDIQILGEFDSLGTTGKSNSDDSGNENRGDLEPPKRHSVLIVKYLRKYSGCMIRALDGPSAITLKLEALDWVHTFGRIVLSTYNDVDSVMSLSEPYGEATISSELLFAILDAAYDMESKVRSSVASTLEVLLQARLICHRNLSTVSTIVLDKLGDADVSIKKTFVRVLSLVLPVAIYVDGVIDDDGSLCKVGPTSIGNKCFSNWKHVLALKQFPRKLNSQHLVSILSYISQRWKVPLSSWIQRLVFSCHGKKDTPSSLEVDLGSNSILMDIKEEGAILDEICTVNSLAAIWWSINEAARYCITLRLRTNLGGPTQTFAALERMLLDIPNVLRLDTEQNESKYLGSVNFHLLPMRLLLDFVEALKKNVYNAYEGSSVLLCPTRQSAMFFRANRKVCEEWFSRICEPMMNAGLALHYDDAILNYSTIRLHELKCLVTSTWKDKPRGTSVSENLHIHKSKLARDAMKVLRHASLALCRRHEPEALLGLQSWASVAFPPLFGSDNQGEAGSSRCFSWMSGLVYQAQGQYEKAAAHFSHLLQSEEALSSMGSDSIQFVIERVIESYTSLSDWKSLDAWLRELQALRATHAGKAYSGALTAAGSEINAVHALARFDEGDIQAALGYLDLTPKSCNEFTLDPKVALERSEQMLLRLMLQGDERFNMVRQELEKAKLMLDEALSIVPLDGLSEVTAYATQLHCIFALEEGTDFNGQEDAKPVSSILGSLGQVLHSPISRVHQDCGLWIKVCRVYRTLFPNSFVTRFLSQRLLSLARKQSNFMLAHRTIQYIMDQPSTCSEGKHTELLAMSLQYESILLRYAEGKQQEAVIDLWSFVRDNMLSEATLTSDIDALKAKACLKFCNWLRQENSDISVRNVLFKVCEDFHLQKVSNGSSFTRVGISFSGDDLISDTNQNIILEEIVGTARKISCHLCPTMGKAWLSYASWCFGQANDSLPLHGSGLKSCSLSSILHPEVTAERFQFTEPEISKVEAIITKICLNNRDIQSSSDVVEHLDSTLQSKNMVLINSLVQQVLYLLQAAAGAPGFESSAGECSSAALSSQLQAFICTNAGSKSSNLLSSVNELVDVYYSLRKRKVSLFGHAAHGYFQYLSYSSSKLEENHYGSPHLVVVKEKARRSSLRAMLYVLHILLNYGVELRETLEHGFATVPLLPWQEITTQMFARLSSHSIQEVREQLEGLLMMLAKRSPWSIIYPLLVDINAYEGKPSEELQRILDFLVKLYPKLVHDVQLVINELGAMTVLWEELWLSTLQDLHADVARRINMLKEDAARVAENSTLSRTEKNKINAAKYSAMMAPIIVSLERRLASTFREPQTAHEMWFQKEYGKHLKSAISSFKRPPESSTALVDVWRPFDAIATSLATYQRKSSISLKEVAPQLALLSSSDIPIPGLEKKISMLDYSGSSSTDVQGIVTVSSVGEQVMILSTKTKPKKLLLLGSDGEKYTYLLKGREDLRLDARIMQLLETVNSFLYARTDLHSRSLAIRYYSVTPISARAGLIQWVDNVTSIYSVYKSWQNRTQLANLSSNGAGNMDNHVPHVPRPSDMFYGKIIPALKEKGIRRAISRKDWPHEVKRKVLLDLMKETPRQLLWQEMWCASEGFKAFSSKAKRFSGTVAAMSMVGHILGLGDRHLDNILMDFSSGDVVHIDYNVCFDKGRRLKIPEIVPFRLTQTIEAALGLTGIEGAFRANCEAIINVLRRNKDILLMLLEVFVWDPLVEWTRGDNHDEATIGGEEKKGMELAVSLSLFASRVQEIRVPLQEHHDLLRATLPAAESALMRFLDVLNKYEVISVISFHAESEKSSVLQHEVSAKSIVAEATSISEKSRASLEFSAHEFGQAKALAAEKAQEAASWVDHHAKILDALRSGSIPDAKAHIRSSAVEEPLSLTCAVLVSGVPLTIVPEPTQVQCHDLDREVHHLIADLETGISCAIETLGEYALALQRVLPINYITNSPVNVWAQILQLSVNNLSSDIISLARRQAAELIVKDQGNGLDIVQQRHRDLFQKMERFAVEIERIDDECSELMSSIGSDSETKSKECLLSSFTKYMQSSGYGNVMPIGSSGQNKHDGPWDFKLQGNLEEKKVKVLSILVMAVIELYKDVLCKVVEISNNSTGITDSGIALFRFEEQIERCVLVADFVNEVQELVQDLTSSSKTADTMNAQSERNWASVFRASMVSSKHLTEQMTEVALPEVVKYVISGNPEVMEAFGCLSHIHGTIETVLEKLAEVEQEREKLVELEKNYVTKVGLIREQQLALEEASMKGRDHLSWEEAEELVSQEETCRAHLDQLNITWNQKDMQNSSLKNIEDNILNSIISSERYFSSLISTEQEGDVHIRRSQALLTVLTNPFSQLESIDQILRSRETFPSDFASSYNLSNSTASGSSFSESTWRSGSILKNHSFFIWKVRIMDSVIDSCLHGISSSVDRNFGFDQLYNVLRKKLEVHMLEQVGRYLKERVAPVLFAQLEREKENLKRIVGEGKEFLTNQVKRDVGAVKRVQLMLEEYCNAHETARAARSAVYLMNRQKGELIEALQKTIFEIVQMEWLHDLSLPYLPKNKVMPPNVFGDDKFYPQILNISRPKLLEKLQSSMSLMAKSVECLQACEKTSVSAEGQLERAMEWACGGPNIVGTGNSSVKNSGIPSEFHEHLVRRRQLLCATREQASDIIKVCTSVMEFEASRDGLFWMPGEKTSGRATADSRTWQQAYLNVVTRLDVTFHSFTRAEQEWKLAQKNMEAAASSLFSATNELSIVSAKAKSASGDLQDTLANIWDCTCEASAVLSAFSHVSKGHTALTSECGTMLEEVLSITEGLHDVYSLGKEAAMAHSALVEDLSKANMILLPLEVSLSTDVAAISDAISKESKSNIEILPVHGQTLYQSYCFRLRESRQSLVPLVSSVTIFAKDLHSLLIKLARISSLHAGNLHEALEGLGESQVVKSQDLSLSITNNSDVAVIFDKEKSFIVNPEDSINFNHDGDSFLQNEGWISPLQHSYTSSQESSIISIDASLSQDFDSTEQSSSTNAGEGCCTSVSLTCTKHLENGTVEKPESDNFRDEVNAISSAIPTVSESTEGFEALLLSNETTASNINSSYNMKKEISEEEKVSHKDEHGSLKQINQHGGSHDDPFSRADLASRSVRGKNSYALSVLRQVEMKLDGRDIDDSRSVEIPEQVDHLLEQATSVDNLCNMYEGWTPWI